MQNGYRGQNPEPVHIIPKPVTTHVTQENILVSTTAVKVLTANPNRNGFIIRNQGAQSVAPASLWWGFNGNITVPNVGTGDDKAQLLQAYEVITSMMDCGNWMGDIYMIAHSSSDSQVSVLEW